MAHWYRGLAYEQKKLYPEALREMRNAKDLLPGNLGVESNIGHVYAVSGNKGEADRVIAGLKQGSVRRYVNPYEVALIYVGLGHNDQAFEWLDKAFREHSDQLVYLKVDPRLDPNTLRFSIYRPCPTGWRSQLDPASRKMSFRPTALKGNELLREDSADKHWKHVISILRVPNVKYTSGGLSGTRIRPRNWCISQAQWRILARSGGTSERLLSRRW